MTSTTQAPVTRAMPPLPVRKPFNGVYALAFIGVLIACYALWTWGAWLLDGPHAVTKYRDPNKPVGRAWLRGGHANFFHSSQWINVNTWTGYAPGVVNPTASQMPQPIIFIGSIYPFGLLGFSMILNKGMAAMRSRWPEISNARLIALTYLGGFSLGILLEAPMFLMNLWGLPGAPRALALFGNGQRFAAAEYVTTAIVFTTTACVRFFRNDKGRTIAERGLENLSAGGRAVVSTSATIALFAMAMWALLLIQIPAGLHAAP